MNSKRILSLVMAMVLAVSLCLPGTTAYAIEPEDDDLESEQVIPTEPALCSYTSNENDRHADIPPLKIWLSLRHISTLPPFGAGALKIHLRGLVTAFCSSQLCGEHLAP